MSDSVVDNQYARLFNQTPLPPTNGMPERTVEASNRLRANNQGDAGNMLGPAVPGVTNAEINKASLLVQQLAAFFNNTNITAAEPAHNKPTWWSQPVDLTGSVNLAATVGSYVTVCTYLATGIDRIMINAYGVNVVDPAFTYDGSILWRIQKKGVNVPTLADWGEQRGSLVRPRSTFIILEPNDLITFQVKRAVAAVGAQVVQMTLLGYSWKPRGDYEGYRASINAS